MNADAQIKVGSYWIKVNKSEYDDQRCYSEGFK